MENHPVNKFLNAHKNRAPFTVDAKELYKNLPGKQPFHSWFNYKQKQNNLEEKRDFIKVKEGNVTHVFMTREAALNITIPCTGSFAKSVRNYLIDVAHEMDRIHAETATKH